MVQVVTCANQIFRAIELADHAVDAWFWLPAVLRRVRAPLPVTFASFEHSGTCRIVRSAGP